MLSADTAEQEKAEQDEHAELESNYAEGLAKERLRIQAELARRNALERSDTECPICFDLTAEADTCVMPCSSKHWLCRGCLRDGLDHDKGAGRQAHACHICRMPMDVVELEKSFGI